MSVVRIGPYTLPNRLILAPMAGVTDRPFRQHLATPLAVYCDVSLQAFDEVLPAAGAVHSAVRIAPQRMAELVDAQWVDVCQEVLQEA